MTEFTVILYAGGNNRLSTDLSIVKSLLPVGNRPLIWYTLEIIKRHPSLCCSPLLILTSNQNRQSLDDYLSTLDLCYELIIHRQHHESSGGNDDQQQMSDELGTIDIIRSCYSKIRTESVCLIACDLFGKVNLTPMINMFRVRDASLVMLLLKTPFPIGKESIAQAGQKSKFTPEAEFYVVDQSTDTVTSIRLRTDLDDDLPIRQNILSKYPRTTIRTDLVDGHVYLIKKSCLDIAIRSNYSSFRKEFLPKMIRQMATNQPIEHLLPTQNQNKILQKQKTIEIDDYTDLTKIMQRYNCDSEQIQSGCYYYINDSQLFRVKNVVSFLEANRQAAGLISTYTNKDVTFKDRLEQIQISSDCIIAEPTDIGKRTTIKRTIIGKNCRIEDKCKITNCVILDNVHIKEGVNLQNSIVCSRATIGSKCDIQNSIICLNQQVETNKKLNGETISATSNEFTTSFMTIDD